MTKEKKMSLDEALNELNRIKENAIIAIKESCKSEDTIDAANELIECNYLAAKGWIKTFYGNGWVALPGFLREDDFYEGFEDYRNPYIHFTSHIDAIKNMDKKAAEYEREGDKAGSLLRFMLK